MDIIDKVKKEPSEENEMLRALLMGEGSIKQEPLHPEGGIKQEPVHPEGRIEENEKNGQQVFDEEETNIPFFCVNNNLLDVKSEDILIDAINNEKRPVPAFVANNDPLNIKSEDTNLIVPEESPKNGMVGSIIEAEETIKKEWGSGLKGGNSTNASVSGFENNKVFTCEICGLTFAMRCRLKKHAEIHKSSSEVPMYQCQKCPFQTRYKSSIESHNFNLHGTSSQLKKFSCEKCNYDTNSISCMKKHYTLKHVGFAEKTEKKDLQCEFCDYKTKKKFRLIAHLRIHQSSTELDMYKCPLCPYQSKHRYGVPNHMVKHKSASETKLFKCELCSYKSKWSHCLRNHIKVHEKKSEHVTIRKCEICEFTTNNIYSLETHMKSHEAKPEKIFTCYTCGYQTKEKGYLVRHMLVHKPVWQLESFECAVCGVRTKTKMGLKSHIMNVHGPAANIQIKPNF
nr:zinc finger protein ZFAT-like isoform X5 [Leptinotarsa decemlineata]